jgi:CrcB protein
VLAIGAGGFLGALARYGVALALAPAWARSFPLATFVINVTGAFVLGFFSTLATERFQVAPEWRLFVATGFLGAYTTFSTFEYETQRLVEAGAVWWGLANVVASVVVGYAAVQLGVWVAR